MNCLIRCGRHNAAVNSGNTVGSYEAATTSTDMTLIIVVPVEVIYTNHSTQRSTALASAALIS